MSRFIEFPVQDSHKVRLFRVDNIAFIDPVNGARDQTRIVLVKGGVSVVTLPYAEVVAAMSMAAGDQEYEVQDA